VGHFHLKKMLSQAQSAEEQGNLKEAANAYALISVYFRKKNKTKDAGKMIMNALRLVPHSGRLYLEEAACLWALKDVTSAKESVSKAVGYGVKQKQFPLYLKAVNKTFQNDPDLKEWFFSSWLDLDRTSPEPFNEFSDFLILQGKNSDAKKIILQGLRLAPQHSGLREKLQIWANQFGQPSEKETVFRFLNEEINLEQFLALFGVINSPHGDQSLKELLFAQPEKLLLEGEAGDMKELGQLIDELEKKLNLDLRTPFEDVSPLMQEFRRLSNEVIGQDSKTRLDLACAFFEMGRYKEAKDELEMIASEQELFGQARYLLGLISLREGRELAALGVFQEVSRLSEPHSNLWKESSYQILKLYLRFEDAASAEAVLQKLEQVDPTYRELKSIKNILFRSRR